MFEFMGEIWFRLFAVPFIGTLVIAVAIKFTGRGESGDRLAAISSGIAFAWVSALVLGIPDFPPARDGSAIGYVIVIGLLLGALLDYYVPKFRGSSRLWETAFDLVFAVAAVWWLRGKIDLISILFFVAWGLVTVRVRRIDEAVGLPCIMSISAAIGIALTAWIGDSLIDRDLALGLASAVAGLTVLSWFNPRMALGFGFVWSTVAGLAVISLRLFEVSEAFLVPLILVGFVYFADTVAVKVPIPARISRFLPLSAVVLMLSILPVLLAAVAAFVALSYGAA